jgi:putative restriction endonuclease
MWIEMSRDEEHGGQGWGLTECLWSPSYKESQHRWAYWEKLLEVQEGDVVVHLSGKTRKAEFIGFSIAGANGYKTSNRPPIPNEWGYAESFYFVPLTDFVQFPDPINLDNVFQQRNHQLRDYYKSNKALKHGKRELIFYTIQGNRLQCQNGAYLSELSSELAKIILGFDFSNQKDDVRPPAITARTGQQIVKMRIRVGQREFSKNIRSNYGNQCCFPNCPITDPQFLVGAHIARWSDVPELRGETSNGLCLCLFHDKAFELGLFTITEDYRIKLNKSKPMKILWKETNIDPYEGQRIRLGKILPSKTALMAHWERINLNSGAKT